MDIASLIKKQKVAMRNLFCIQKLEYYEPKVLTDKYYEGDEPRSEFDETFEMKKSSLELIRTEPTAPMIYATNVTMLLINDTEPSHTILEHLV